MKIENYKIPRDMAEKLSNICADIERDCVKKVGVDTYTARLLVARFLNRFAALMQSMSKAEEGKFIQ